MTRMAAEKVIQGLLTASAALNETIRLVQTERLALSRNFGNVLAR